MSNFKDFFVKEKPVFTGIARGVGGFAFGVSGIAEVSPSFTASGGAITLGSNSANGYTYHVFTRQTLQKPLKSQMLVIMKDILRFL